MTKSAENYIEEIDKLKREIKQLKSAEVQLENKYNRLISSINEVILIMDKNNIFVEVYCQNELDFFLPTDKIEGKKFSEILPPEIDALFIAALDKLDDTGEKQRFEYALTINDDDKYFSASIKPLENSSNIIADIRNITGRKKAEEELRISETKCETWIDNSPVCTKIVDLNFNLQYMSYSGIKELKIKDINEFYDKPYPFSFYPNSFKKSMIDNMEKVKETGETITNEASSMDTEGNELWYQSTIVPVYDKKGKQDYFLIVSLEITDRKLAEKEIVETKQFYANIIEGVQDGILVTDENDTIYFANVAMEFITGIPREKICGNNILKDFSLETTGELVSLYMKAKIEKKPVWYDVKIQTPSCKNTWQNGWLIPKYIDDKFAGIICTIRDITKRKQMEIALTENEYNMRTIFNSMKDVIFEMDYNGFLLYIAPTSSRFTLKSLETKVGMNLHDLFPKKQANLFLKFIQKCLDKNEPDIITYPLEIDNKTIWFEGRAIPKTDKSILYIVRDITDQKNTDEALRESEERFRSITEQINDMIFLTDNKGLIKYISPSSSSIFGYNPQEMEGSLFVKFLKKTEIPKAMKEFLNTFISGSHTIDMELIMKHKNGNVFSGELSARKYISNDFNGTIGVIRDITERKQIEMSLRESESRFKALHNASFGGISIHDKGIILECNKGLSDITGYTTEELIGMDGLKLIAEESQKWVLNNIYTGFEKQYEAIGIRKNEEKYPLRLEAREIPYKGKHVRVVEFRDITEQKKADETLRNSEFKFQHIFENKGTATGIYDNKGIIKNCNSKFVELVGYSKEEIIGIMSWKDFVYPEDLNVMINFNKYRLDKENFSPTQYESRIISQSGDIINVIINVSLNGEERIVSLIDISELKLAEAELKGKMTELEIFNDVAVDRELVINDLRDEINQLLEKLGEDKKYDIVE